MLAGYDLQIKDSTAAEAEFWLAGEEGFRKS